MIRALPIAAAAFTLAALAYFLWGTSPSPAVWLASGIAITGAVLGAIVPPRCARTHAAIAAGLMLAVGAFAATRVIGRWPFVWDALGDARYAGFIAVMGLAVAIGLVRGALWARWAALAFAAGSALGGSLNWIQIHTRDEGTWLAALGVVGSITIISQLVRPSVRERFGNHARHAVWASRDRLVISARIAAIANFAAAPMLLLYAFGQPVAPATVIPAVALAPVLFAGSALVVMRRAAGVVVLGIGGLGLLAHTIASVELVQLAWNVRIVAYYACFWVPAGVLGIVAGALALRRIRSFG